ncbi:MAG: carbohydrate ABC transporter permease [Chloroflexi bacterium]|nr:carbohydrate ABC transporter permease [Chloroflexota bacterium]
MNLSPRARKRLGTALIYLQIFVVLLVILLPLAWMVVSSLRNNVDIIRFPPRLDAPITLKNYRNLLQQYTFGQYAVNSVIIVTGSTLLGMLLGVPAAYAAARFNMQRWAFLTLVARMAPGVLFLIPWYIVAIRFRLTDNFLTLITTHTVITMPVIVWLMVSFFEELPKDIEEAARIDGCSHLQVLLRVAIPLAVPGLAVSAILSFIFSWNYFLFALILAGVNTMPLTIAAFQFIGISMIDWGGLFAAATVISLPPLVLTLFVQRWLVRGLTAGAVKG